MFFVYILISVNSGKYYIGQTKDVEARLHHHNSGLDTFTSKYLPWELLFQIAVDTRSEALQLEKKLKNLSRSRLETFMKKNKKDK